MTLYVNAPVSELWTLETTGEMQTVDSRAHATELSYADAAYLRGLAQEQWTDLDWQIEHVGTRRFIVKGESKGRR